MPARAMPAAERSATGGSVAKIVQSTSGSGSLPHQAYKGWWPSKFLQQSQWAYLYRAVDKFGNTIDFYLSPTRNTKAAKRFLGKLNGLKDWDKPRVINTDKVPTYVAALAELKKEGQCPKDTQHRQVKYLNNVVEA